MNQQEIERTALEIFEYCKEAGVILPDMNEPGHFDVDDLENEVWFEAANKRGMSCADADAVASYARRWA